MKYFLLLFIVLVVGSISSVSAAPDKNEVMKETFLFEGKKRTYYLFVPTPSTDKTPMPLLVTLHGSGHNGLSLVEKWKDLAISEGLIIVGPDAQNPESWNARQDGPDFLHTLIEALKAKYPINPRRVYVFGHSGGASMALQMSLYESEYFAAAAVHAGALVPAAYPIIAYATRKIPLAIWVGDKDPFFPLAVVNATHDALGSAGITVQVNIIKNHDHDYYELAPKINLGVWEFLKQHELSADPSYRQYQFHSNPK